MKGFNLGIELFVFMCWEQKEQINSSNKIIFIWLCRNKIVFVKELDIIDSKFELSGVVTGQSCQQVQFSESSFMIKIEILAWNKKAYDYLARSSTL